MGLFTKPMTVKHVTGTGTDANGRPTKTVTTTNVTGGYRHRLTTDTFDGSMIVTDEWTAYMPPATAIAVGDIVTIDSDDFEVVSKPFPAWNHRLSGVHHLEVRLRQVTR